MKTRTVTVNGVDVSVFVNDEKQVVVELCDECDWVVARVSPAKARRLAAAVLEAADAAEKKS